MMGRKELTQREMIFQLRQAVIGIEENPKENGLIGKVDTIVDLLREQNGRIRKNSKLIYILYGILGASGAGFGVSQLFMGG